MNNLTTLQPPNPKEATMVRLIDPQRVYADSLRDAARRNVLEKSIYPGTIEAPIESTGATKATG